MIETRPMPGTRRPARTTLPSGTLTFLFTDIEGSTRLWAAHPEAMGKAVSRHDTLLRQCIAAHGGQVFKTVGDAFHAAFATAPDSVAAALSAQQALRAERWPEGLPVRVRMGVHTGAAELREGDYFGPPLNYVARLLALGHGGQTLVSEITSSLCRDQLPIGATLKALGEHALKDVGDNEAVFQLCHAGLIDSFPPLRTSTASPVADATPSIAVLPFADLSAEKDQEYFADGLAEELLNVLSNIHGLRVASRTSAFSFKGSTVDIPTAARKLNVRTILEGSVRKAGKRVRITAQLIDVATDSHLWSEAYDRELDDIFAVQDDIAQSVVGHLQGALLGAKHDVSARVITTADVQAATKGRSDNPEAYRLYLQAQFFLQRMSESDEAKAVDYYQQALAIDPDYALAWAGLAEAHANRASGGDSEEYEKAREAALRALALQPDLPEAHMALGRVQLAHDWDWAGADASHRRALQLAPANTRVLRGAARLALNRGRVQEAIALLRQAIALDPLNALLHLNLAHACLDAGDIAGAEAAASTSVELNPIGSGNHFFLGQILMLQGRVDEALMWIEQETSAAWRLTAIAMVQHARGRAAESDAALQQLIKQHSGAAAFQIAQAYAFRGDADAAFEWLDRAYLQRDPGMVQMKWSMPLRHVHGDPRWQSFLEKMGLVD